MPTSLLPPADASAVTRRIHWVNTATAASILVLAMVAVAAVPGASQRVALWIAATFALNTWIVVRLKRTRMAEYLHAALNVLLVTTVGHASQWAFPLWGFMPFSAVIFGQRNHRHSLAALLLICGSMDVLALSEGVDWVIPCSTTCLSLGLYALSKLSFSITRNMVVRMGTQYDELVRMHDDLRGAHDAVKTEAAARKRVETELLQSQKLEAVGRLAAGVAHELNTPVQFVNDNITFVNDSMQDVAAVMQAYRELRDKVAAGTAAPSDADALIALEVERDLAFVEENVPLALVRSVDGLTRVATIVRSMKEFAHPARKDMALADINRAIRSTLDVARNEYKYVATVEPQFGDIPQIMCFLGDLNQVFLNLLVNAAHAIGDVVKDTPARGIIKVRTSLEDAHVVVRISDTGTGIPEEAQKHMFEPFFTTKPVGKGTGQGLAISRQVVVEKHGGTLTFDTQPGCGTTFTIRIPARQAEHEVVASSAP